MNLVEIIKKAKYEKNRIIQHRVGPAIVIAGPGSGKTTTLAEKIVSLCSDITPTRIVALTFTNNAANEMKAKIKKICLKSNQEHFEPCISTLHSLAKGLLHCYSNKLGLSSVFRVVSKMHEKILLKDVCWELKSQKINLGRYQNRYLKRFRAYRAFVPNSNLDAIAKIPIKQGIPAQEQFNECYRSLLDYYHCLDWYDIVGLAVKLLSENRDVHEEVIEKIDHLLVDEYQDLNCADHELIRLLSIKAKSLIVFADDDQSIYQTGRFANPEGVKGFNEIYSNAKIYPLSVCWRCGSSIIDAAWKLVNVDDNKLPERMHKDKPIPNPRGGPGKFKIKSLKSEKDEIRTLCDEVQNELKETSPPKNISILFHSREIGQKYADVLKTKGINIENQLSKREVSKAVLLLYEVLCLLNNEFDNLAARFLLQEIFKIDTKIISKARNFSRNQNKSLWQTITEMDNSEKKVIKYWNENFKKWRQMNEVIKIIKDIIEIIKIHNEAEIQKIMEWCNKEKNITLNRIIEYLEKGIDLDKSVSAKGVENKTTRVVIMTMHGAKGLDADVVFVPALEDELIPNKWYEPEQRRLLYVSMTRAKERLFLSWAWSRTGKSTYRSGNRAETHRRCSRFLDEINK